MPLTLTSAVSRRRDGPWRCFLKNSITAQPFRQENVDFRGRFPWRPMSQAELAKRRINQIVLYYTFAT